MSPDLDLTPVNVGFDLRRHPAVVAVPTSTRWVRYVHGQRIVQSRGDAKRCVRALRAAGYRAALSWAVSPN